MTSRYLKKIQKEISQSISGNKKIYLDTNYWLRLTDCKSEKDIVLLNLLTKLVITNKAIIPISEYNFWEILKQKDRSSLNRSAVIIDKLSKGISITSEKERQKLEFLQFIKINTGEEFDNLQEIVWTKLSLTIIYPIFLKYEPNLLFEDFITFLSKISFEEILVQLDKTSNFKPFYHKDDIVLLNSEKEKYKDQNKSFHEMFLSELGGYLDLFENDLSTYFQEYYCEKTGNIISDEEKQNFNHKSWKNMIYNLSKLKKITSELPSFTIFPEMNAVARWNKNRKYKDGNDTFDFLHTSSALPYFDYFFTEKELKTVISQRKLDQTFNCKVSSNIDEILSILEEDFI
ncbi:hypothetical protein [Flavobacterium sp. HJSW_4]|uniref:hypothetical protein n=1 Tax=Flavobacterium sp. HJSW_4 TaxID=3344660 RepID=UPI0035F32D8D